MDEDGWGSDSSTAAMPDSASSVLRVFAELQAARAATARARSTARIDSATGKSLEGL